MKQNLLLLMRISATLMLGITSYGQVYAQQRNLKNELLVYIQPDSLEMPKAEKGAVSYTRTVILSKSLKEALEKVKPLSIAKAFPDWNSADSIAISEEGGRVKKPEFGRIFTLVFNSEREADAAIAVLQRSAAIVFAEKNSQPKLHADPGYDNGKQWHLKNNGANGGLAGADIHAEEAWQIFTGSPSVKIGIFDTGLEITHTELSGKSSGETNIAGTAYEYHGTHVARIAAAKANNGQGGRGVDWNAQILSKRIFEPAGYIGDAAVSSKITDAINNGVNVFNHSWGGPGFTNTLAMAFAYAYKMNRTSVVSMGNNNGSVTQYPAGYNNVIAVGATQNTDQHS